jgi:hypothetical protein
VPADREHVAGLIGADGKRLAREVCAVAGKEIDGERAEAIDRQIGRDLQRAQHRPSAPARRARA